MLIIENLFLALSGLKSNKMRSLLTMLGIIIGIAAVIAIVSIGDSISASVEKSIKDMGFENISLEVRKRTVEGEQDYGYYEDEKKPETSDLLTMNQIKAFREKFRSEVSVVSISKEAGIGKVRIGRKSETVSLNGTNYGYSEMRKLKIIQGRYFEDRDVDRIRKVAVIPGSVAKKLELANGEVIGQELRVVMEDKVNVFTIIGVFDDTPKAGGLFGDFIETPIVCIPATLAGEITGKSNYQSVELVPRYGVNSAELTQKINEYFGTIYAGNKDFSAVGYNMKGSMDSYTQTLTKTKLAIAVIAGISLLVGGIGVMNIMLVSVTERTREIGVRKALGAKDRFIRLQFIVEAIIICVIGGIIGVSLGLCISWVISSMMGNAVVISAPVILISVMFSMAIGVFFGYYPANKAASLDPIEALRYE